MSKKLTKSKNQVISGVCGGIAEFTGIDVTLVRIGWVLFTFFGGSGIIAYIICAFIMPHPPIEHHSGDPHDLNHPNSN